MNHTGRSRHFLGVRTLVLQCLLFTLLSSYAFANKPTALATDQLHVIIIRGDGPEEGLPSPLLEGDDRAQLSYKTPSLNIFPVRNTRMIIQALLGVGVPLENISLIRPPSSPELKSSMQAKGYHDEPSIKEAIGRDWFSLTPERYQAKVFELLEMPQRPQTNSKVNGYWSHQLSEAFGDLNQKLSQARQETVLIIFTGHGGVDGTEAFITTQNPLWDMYLPKERRFLRPIRAIPISGTTFANMLKTSFSNKNVVMVHGSCYSGLFQQQLTESLRTTKAKLNFVSISSTTPDENMYTYSPSFVYTPFLYNFFSPLTTSSILKDLITNTKRTYATPDGTWMTDRPAVWFNQNAAEKLLETKLITTN